MLDAVLTAGASAALDAAGVDDAVLEAVLAAGASAALDAVAGADDTVLDAVLAAGASAALDAAAGALDAVLDAVLAAGASAALDTAGALDTVLDAVLAAGASAALDAAAGADDAVLEAVLLAAGVSAALDAAAGDDDAVLEDAVPDVTETDDADAAAPDAAVPDETVPLVAVLPDPDSDAPHPASPITIAETSSITTFFFINICSLSSGGPPRTDAAGPAFHNSFISRTITRCSQFRNNLLTALRHRDGHFPTLRVRCLSAIQNPIRSIQTAASVHSSAFEAAGIGPRSCFSSRSSVSRI